MTRRSRNLTDTDIAMIVSILDGWSVRLSWEGLIAAIEARMGQTYTRQALSKHPRVLHAFQLRKRAAVDERMSRSVPDSTPELDAALQRIARLEAENLRLESERTLLLEQFARWAYNAHSRGLNHEILDRPLPPVDRDQTKRSLKMDKSAGG